MKLNSEFEEKTEDSCHLRLKLSAGILLFKTKIDLVQLQ